MRERDIEGGGGERGEERGEREERRWEWDGLLLFLPSAAACFPFLLFFSLRWVGGLDGGDCVCVQKEGVARVCARALCFFFFF